MGDLEERLRSHSSAFDGLLSLIPAKNYYAPKEGNTQWNKRKQSKAESARKKKAKLDPDALVSAVEVRDLGRVEGSEDEDEDEDEEMEDAEDDNGGMGEGQSGESEAEAEAGEGMGIELGGEEEEDGERSDGFKDVSDEEQKGGREKRKDDRKGKKDKIDKEKDKNTPRKKDKKDKKSTTETPAKPPAKLTKSEKKKHKRAAQLEEQKAKNATAQANKDTIDNGEAMDIDSNISLPGLADDTSSHPSSSQQANGTSTSLSTASTSPALSNTTTSTTPPFTTDSTQPPPESDSIIDKRARLAAKIAALRAARKAIGTHPSTDNDEFPTAPRTRQELIEARAKKDALRSAKKAEARKAAQASKKAASAVLTPPANGIVASSSRGTSVDGGVSSPAPALPLSNYSFGKVVFDDGDSLNGIGDGGKGGKKRPRQGDAKALLEQVQRKKARLGEMDEEKRGKIEESDRWGKALSKVNGDKVRDDEKLLKKSVKRVEGRKRRSEREWNDRKESVEKAKAMKQKKRDDNIAKRKEQKKAGKSGKKVPKKGGKVNMKGYKKGGKKGGKGRPGFEGGFGAKAGGK